MIEDPTIQLAAVEVNFDGLIGPTHSYAGLSYGNLASTRHGQRVSNPRRAALEGLAKMKVLAELGIPQAVLPPQFRPDLATLRALGFSGSDSQVLAKAAKEDPVLLAACSSASSMWTANAATVSPSADCADGKVHFTPANLVSQFHRSLEPPATAATLRRIFADERFFAHHAPLPATQATGDEGAANHTRLCTDYGKPGVELFVYGRRAFDKQGSAPERFPARQTFEASSAVARLHALRDSVAHFAQQSPRAVDAGAFHNDVVSVGNLNVFFYHGSAFVDATGLMESLSRWFEKSYAPFLRIEVREERVPLKTAIATYLFNSQLVRTGSGGMMLIAPVECEEDSRVREYLHELVAARSTPIETVKYVDVRQSMSNGGGPACLRLRVVLQPDELAAVHAPVFLNDERYAALVDWVQRRYRESLAPADLADPQLLVESRDALDELTTLLDLGLLYPFQR